MEELGPLAGDIRAWFRPFRNGRHDGYDKR
jgi:hypothetical protein